MTRNYAMRLPAQGLGARGFASLRFDYCLSGRTALTSRDESRLTRDTVPQDAGRRLRMARERYPGRLVVPLGHGESGVAALRLTQLAPVDALVPVAVPGRPMDRIIVEQVENGCAPAATIEVQRGILTRLQAGRPAGEVPATLHALLRPGVYPCRRPMLAFDGPDKPAV